MVFTIAEKLLFHGTIYRYEDFTADFSNPNTPLRLRVVDVGKDKLRHDQTFWSKLTEHTIGGELGTNKILIKPGDWFTINEPATDRQE